MKIVSTQDTYLAARYAEQEQVLRTQRHALANVLMAMNYANVAPHARVKLRSVLKSVDGAIRHAQGKRSRYEHAKLRHEVIPATWPVQPVGDMAAYKQRMWPEETDLQCCGHCNLWWDDAIVTSMTPAPSARCPFEQFHVY